MNCACVRGCRYTLLEIKKVVSSNSLHFCPPPLPRSPPDCSLNPRKYDQMSLIYDLPFSGNSQPYTRRLALQCVTVISGGGFRIIIRYNDLTVGAHFSHIGCVQMKTLRPFANQKQNSYQRRQTELSNTENCLIAQYIR